MKKAVVFVAFALLISMISAECTTNQIDVNIAPAEELDKLTGIGPAYAANIISSRPFVSVDDLIRVSGIGEITLQKIKYQGLACVSGEAGESGGTADSGEEENESIIVIEDEEKETAVEDEKTTETESPSNSSVLDKITANADVVLEEIKQNDSEDDKIIILGAKDIKSQENSENSDKNRYLLYSLMGFGTLVLFLAAIKYNKYKKNELQ